MRIVRAAGWSDLLMTMTSGISMTPALSAWIESPEPGWRTSTTVSATDATSTSLCPTPTVSSRSTSMPAASRMSSAWSVASATPPRWPRVLIERMKTPSSRKWSASRMRSPRSAPFENGLEGSTDTTPIVLPCSRRWPTRAPRRLDFPTPGGPVNPATAAEPVRG